VVPAASVTALGRWLDHLDRQDKLPRMLVYSLNPAPLYEIATMLGNFNHGFNRNCPGKLQIGAAWWHLDHIDGITEQLKAAANTGTLGLFPGMLTDSRSFLSYPRHDYFRRILCNLLGGWVEEESCDMDTAIKTAEAVAYGNAFQELGVRS
ncbi:MAG: glucuronate isomerase, partial [Oscillospiraceae bacterium]|nr:glucuronate isomerase [Oscillospiraceae bacterium]